MTKPSAYIVRGIKTNQYIGRKTGQLTDNINNARIYSRVSDIKNSLWKNYYTGKFEDCYEIIPCDLIPQIQDIYEVSYVHGIAILRDGTHFIKRGFKTLQDAEDYRRWASHETNLHIDYFPIAKIKGNIKEYIMASPMRQRPTWQDYFLGLALVISKRSHDIHTQHGCIIVDDETHHILGTGYNGFPRGMHDDQLPTSRPEKYDWMVHSEVNACNNMITDASKPTTAYITGEPCTPCLVHLWQRGIKKVVHRRAYGSQLVDEKMRKNQEILLAQTGMKVYAVEADLRWLSHLN